jgi:hypothetical protein
LFCDVSKLDDAQRAYVLAMRSQIAKEKVASLTSRGSASRSEHEYTLYLFNFGYPILEIM